METHHKSTRLYERVRPTASMRSLISIMKEIATHRHQRKSILLWTFNKVYLVLTILCTFHFQFSWLVFTPCYSSAFQALSTFNYNYQSVERKIAFSSSFSCFFFGINHWTGFWWDFASLYFFFFFGCYAFKNSQLNCSSAVLGDK